MVREFIGPLGNRVKSAAAWQKPKRSPRSKSESLVDRRSFLIWVAIWILLITVIQNISGASPTRFRPAKEGTLTLSISSLSPRRLHARIVSSSPATEPAIAVWRGPVQPVSISPKSPVPVFLSIPTTEPVVFVGLDDGWVQTPEELDWLTRHHLPFSLFLTDNGIKNNYDYFKELQAAGMTIENHSLSHPDLTSLDFEQQKAEICRTADIYQRVFGRRPLLFRPPYGTYNDDTRRVAASCGIKAIVLWHVVIGTGGDVQFQSSNHHLQAGDIVLMHFRPEFLSDVRALEKEVRQNHLQIGRLEDWLR